LSEISESYFENVLQVEEVTYINNKWCCFVRCNWYPIDTLELVCNFTKGQEIECSMYEEYDYSMYEDFVCYCPELKNPFVAVDDNGNVANWEFARAIQPKYKAFTELKLEWVGNIVKNKETKKPFAYMGSLD